MTYFGARYYISKQTSYKKNAIDKPRLINLITGSVFFMLYGIWWPMKTPLHTLWKISDLCCSLLCQREIVIYCCFCTFSYKRFFGFKFEKKVQSHNNDLWFEDYLIFLSNQYPGAIMTQRPLPKNCQRHRNHNIWRLKCYIKLRNSLSLVKNPKLGTQI